MSIISRFCRVLLIAHGLMNVAQGIYGLASPQEYGQMVGDMFAGSSDQALQSIGLGSIGVGWYQLVFAYQNNRTLILATIPMRLFFAIVMWNWGNSAVMGYEAGVAVVCGLTLLG